MECWKDNELGYLMGLVRERGDTNVGHAPAVIASYLRLQVSSADKFNVDLGKGILRASQYVDAGHFDAAYDCLARLRRAKLDTRA